MKIMEITNAHIKKNAVHTTLMSLGVIEAPSV